MPGQNVAFRSSKTRSGVAGGCLGLACVLLCLGLVAGCNNSATSLTTGQSGSQLTDNGGQGSQTPGGGDAGEGGPDNAVQSSAQISVLSNRADLISGGDALVKVVVPASVWADNVAMSLNGRDITGQFQRLKNGDFEGLVKGLKLGKNTLVAHLPGGDAETQIINHPNGGPVFSGPQLTPWHCDNRDGKLAKNTDDCNQRPVLRFYYKSTDTSKNGLQPWDPEHPPTDVASVTTQTGQTVPFIVREEIGYQDRDQYRVAVLYQPGKPWTAVHPQPQFAHKVLVNHGGNCGVRYKASGAPGVLSYKPIAKINSVVNSVLPLDDTLGSINDVIPLGITSPLNQLSKDVVVYALGQGFAIMSTDLDNTGHNCNVALEAESLMMAKEHIVEQYGTLRYTIGEGCSGGALAQQWIANAYPGIYQGILPTCSFPDAWSVATQFLDYHLLLNYFEHPGKWGTGVLWLPTQMADVEGHLTILNSIVSDLAQFHVLLPTDDCDGITAKVRYNPKTNPGGVRCDIQDASINLLGHRPQSVWSQQEKKIGHGFASVPLDNVGVQYGLKMLQIGDITPAQFIDLNKKIGGLDQDGQFMSSRMQAVEPALSNAYRTGLINETSNMGSMAIIDCRGPDPGLFHDTYRAFAIRARLKRANGTHANQLIWEGPIPLIADAQCAINSFKAMDHWLAVVAQDTRKRPLWQKIIDDKPEHLQDRCYDGVGQKLTDGLCPDIKLPDVPAGLANIGIVAVYKTPRMVAGDDITTDANKCQLRPLDRSDNYGPIGLSDAQWAQLHTIFPHGVCDFSKPGVAQQPTVAWQTYQDSQGNVIYGGTALPPAPTSSGQGWASPAFALFSQ